MPFDPTAFANAESDFNRDDPPAPGEYEVELTDADIFTAKSSGDQFIKFTWKVVSGFARDHVWGSIHNLEALDRNGEPASGRLGFTKRTCRAVMGDRIDLVQNAVDLRREAERAVGGQYVVEVTRNGAYTNTDVQRSLNGASATPPTAPSSYGQQAAPPAQQPSASGIGSPAGGSNAVYQGDGPSSSSQPQSQGMLGPDEVRRDIERTGESDVPGPQPGEFEHPPQKGDIDPETGEPIPF
jgi:hypothetical protein